MMDPTTIRIREIAKLMSLTDPGVFRPRGPERFIQLFLAPEREKTECAPGPLRQIKLRRGFNIRDVNRLISFIQGSGNLHLLPGERFGFRLVVQLVERFRRFVKQNVFTTHLYAGFSTCLSVVGPHLFEH
jgi:hypothetical protein